MLMVDVMLYVRLTTEKGEVIEKFSENHCNFGLQTKCSKELPPFETSYVVTEAFFNP